MHPTDEVQMFIDLTYAENENGDNVQNDLTIFDEVYKMIDRAEQFIVLDLFLFDHYSDEDIDFPPIAQTLSSKLVQKKKEHSNMPIIFITDPVNIGYGSYDNPWLEEMKAAGIEVVYTDLDPLLVIQLQSILVCTAQLSGGLILKNQDGFRMQWRVKPQK